MTNIVTVTGKNNLELWGEAFEAWLTRLNADTTRRAYKSAWRVFLAFVDKAPWQVGKADVVRWVNDMESHGYAQCTIHLRLSAISSFYEFARNDFTTTGADGAESPLINRNPAAARTLRKKISPYGKASPLTTAQAKTLLGSIDRANAQGARDYALILAFLLTGRRNSELRKLQWKNIEYEGKTVWYVWSGKGKTDQKYEMPRPVWEAILEWLRLVGRLEHMQRDDYIFTATNRITPLSMREIGRMLKKYAARCGLDAEEIHVHTLRHTAAMLRREAGDDILDISEFLGHSSVATTQIYLHRIGGRKDKSSGRVGGLLGL